MKTTIQFDFNNMMQYMLGEVGIQEAEIQAVDTASAFTKVQRVRGTGMMGWTELPYNQAEVVEDICNTAKDIRKRCKNFVVLGIGGSALGPMAVFTALNHLYYNQLPQSRRRAPKLFVEDNIDPERMAALLDVIDVKETIFNVITKSGSTSETMSQFLIISQLLEAALGADAAQHIIATTDAEKGNLIRIAKQKGYKIFTIPAGVGGRFSELSPVGLLAAAVTGIEIKKLLAGAKAMDQQCQKKKIQCNPALMAAALQYIAMQKGKNISVMMPYADSLKLISDWYCQLWGESLGKALNLRNEVVHTGQTPVKALGVTDQHSQIQLYTEGPNDKVVTFICVQNYRTEVPIPKAYADIPAVGFLGGHTLNELITAEQAATEFALTKSGKMNWKIILPQVDAFTVGQLLYFFMMQTAFCGALLGIDTFNQPGVEEGKNATYALLGRPGYEEKRRELENAKVPQAKYQIG